MIEQIRLEPIKDEMKYRDQIFACSLEDFDYLGDDSYAIMKGDEFIGIIIGYFDGDIEDVEDEPMTFTLELIEVIEENRGKGYGEKALRLLKDLFSIEIIQGDLNNIPFGCYDGFKRFLEKFDCHINQYFDDDNMGYIWRGEGTFDDFIEEYYTISL